MKKKESELDKLEHYLKQHKYKYDRIDELSDKRWYPRHQIIVYYPNGERAWDAICQYGSYGFEKGLLEIYGDIVDAEIDGISVAGYLTANDVIRRLEH